MTPNQFLETLKSRLAEAQKRYSEAQAHLQKSQADFNAAAQEVNSWQIAMNAEARKQQASAGLLTPPQPSLTLNAPGSTAPNSDAGGTNKTEAIREILRQHPNGITPGEIWKELKGQIAHRPYMYSILKRLKDKGESMERRGKYFLKPAVNEEGKNQATIQ